MLISALILTTIVFRHFVSSLLTAIRDRIATVKNTKKITMAMKLVAAAKVRRAQDAVLATRPFSETSAASPARPSTCPSSLSARSTRSPSSSSPETAASAAATTPS